MSSQTKTPSQTPSLSELSKMSREEFAHYRESLVSKDHREAIDKVLAENKETLRRLADM